MLIEEESQCLSVGDGEPCTESVAVKLGLKKMPDIQMEQHWSSTTLPISAWRRTLWEVREMGRKGGREREM